MLSHMRTTLILPDDLFRQVKTTSAVQGVTMTSFVEQALREAIRRRTTPAEQPEFTLAPAFVGDGVQPGVDLNDSAALLDLMEGR